MRRYEIIRPSGNTEESVVCKVASLEYQGDWMNGRYVTASVKSPVLINFKVGDKIEYRGETFELRDLTSIKKVANSGTYGEAFTYSNIKLESLINDLVRTAFLNYTFTNESSSTVGGTLNNEFAFHCVDVRDLVNRVNANMKRALEQRIISNGWSFECSEDVAEIGKKDMTIDVSGINCLEALKKVYEDFGLGYVINKSERKVVVGVAEDVASFSFGKGNGLRDIERTVNNDSDVITRLRVVGSEKNLPRHYYYNRERLWRVEYNLPSSNYKPTVKIVEGGLGDHNIITITPKFIPKGTSIKAKFDFSYNGGSIEEKTLKYDSTNNCFIYDAANTDFSKKMTAYYNKKKADNQSMNIPMTIESVYVENCAQSLKSYYGDTNSDLLQLQNLMPTYSKRWDGSKLVNVPTYGEGVQFNLDPYFDSSNIAEIGIREGYIKFDSEDAENGVEEIFPTITNGNNKIVTGDNITDDGIFGEGVTIPPFVVAIGNIGFDLNYSQANGRSDLGTLCMTSGMCGGREFSIVKCEQKSAGYELTLKRVEDSGLEVFYPNKNYHIGVNDTFIIKDIEMPDMYVTQAGELLAEKALAYLAKHDKIRYNYNITIDNIHLAREHDENGEDSIYWNIKEGDRLIISDAELGIDNESISIDRLTIKEGGSIPQISVTLRNEKKEKTLLAIAKSTSMAQTTANTAVRQSKKRTTINDVEEIATQIVNNVESVSEEEKGGEDNVLEGVQVGGVDLPISNKKVNITKVPSATNADNADHATSADNATNANNANNAENANKAKEADHATSADSATIANGADKLNTKHKIFGNDFDGTSDVSGELNNVTNINASGKVKGSSGEFANISNSEEIVTKNLKVTGSAEFFELLIDKIRSIGGSRILSQADGFKVDAVQKSGTTYIYLYWRADDNNVGTTNTWRVGDYALCKNFNTANVGTTAQINNQYYWCYVGAVSSSPRTTYYGSTTNYIDTEHNYYHYIRLNIATNVTTPYFDGNVVPNPNIGDEVVQLGHKKQSSETADAARKRGSALYLSACDSLDTGLVAPFIAQYVGINYDNNNIFNLSAFRRSYDDAVGSKVVGTFEVVSGNTTTPLEDYVSNKVSSEVQEVAPDYMPYIGANGEWYVNGTSTGVKAQGEKGTGVSIVSTEVKYQVGNNGTTAPTGTWTTAIPSVAEGKYLWTRTVVTYTDGKSTTSYMVSYKAINGTDGTDGEDGADGKNAFVLSYSPTSIVFNTDDSGVVTDQEQVTLTLREGDTDISDTPMTVTIMSVTNCLVDGKSSGAFAFSADDIKDFALSIPASAYSEYTIDGQKIKMPPTSGNAVLSVRTEHGTYLVTISFSVNVNAYYNKFVVDLKEFKSEYTRYKTDTDGTIQKMQSTISQKADEIALKVVEGKIDNYNNIFYANNWNFDKTWSPSVPSQYSIKVSDVGIASQLTVYSGSTGKVVKPTYGSHFAYICGYRPSSVTTDLYAFIRPALPDGSDNRLFVPAGTYTLTARILVNNINWYYGYGVQIETYANKTGGNRTGFKAISTKPSTNGEWDDVSLTFTLDNDCYIDFIFGLYLTTSAGTSSAVSNLTYFLLDCIKLEKGTKFTGWDPSLADKLIETGIDITSGRIKFKADNIDAENNDGEKTIGVDQHGNLSIAGAIEQTIQIIDMATYKNEHLLIPKPISDYRRSCDEGNLPFGTDVYMYSLDVWKCANVIKMYNIDDNIILPFLVTDNSSLAPYYFQTFRFDDDTQQERQITKDDMLKLVGKKLVIYGNQGRGDDYRLYYITPPTRQANGTYTRVSRQLVAQHINTDSCFIFEFVHGIINDNGTYGEGFWWDGMNVPITIDF